MKMLRDPSLASSSTLLKSRNEIEADTTNQLLTIFYSNSTHNLINLLLRLIDGGIAQWERQFTTHY